MSDWARAGQFMVVLVLCLVVVAILIGAIVQRLKEPRRRRDIEAMRIDVYDRRMTEGLQYIEALDQLEREVRAVRKRLEGRDPNRHRPLS